jgi:hypothetical protein
MENINYRGVQTDLELNGPFISISENPVGVGSTVTGSVTLSGIATVSWATTVPSSIGPITYQWYEVGSSALSDSATISGSGTSTVTISNLRSPEDNNRKFFVEAQYTPTNEYQTSEKGTGNVLNPNPVATSGVGTITVDPLIVITSQPTISEVNPNETTTFTIGAELTDPSYGDVEYQWSLNGNPVSDGTITDTLGQEALVLGVQDFTFTGGTSFFNPFPEPQTIELIDAREVFITISGGNGGVANDGFGGSVFPGGRARGGRFEYLPGQTGINGFLRFEPGSGGNSGGNFLVSGGGGAGIGTYAGGGKGTRFGGGGGGAASAVFDVNLDRYIIVAGGGGGGAGTTFRTSTVFADGFDFDTGRAALSNSTSSPKDGTDGISEFSLVFRVGTISGGGGGGGMQPADNVVIDGNTTIAGVGGVGDYGAGGASGYDDRVVSAPLDSFVVENVRFTSIATRNTFITPPSGFANINYIGRTRASTIVTRNTVISGSRTNTLTLSANVVGVQTVSCTVTSSVATNTPVVSNSATFVVTEGRTEDQTNVIVVEGIPTFGSLKKSVIDASPGEDYLFDSISTQGFTNEADNRSVKLYNIYSPDKDIDVEMELHGGSGAGSNPGIGGYSKIRFTLERNVEYVISGLFNGQRTGNINTPFLYKKGTLIACVGGGGDTGVLEFFSFTEVPEKGGDGGGIGISGESTNTAHGGEAIPAGTLPSDGIFGSRDIPTDSAGKRIFLSRFPDTQANKPLGGRTLPCPRGEYWREQGFAPCADLGNVQYRTANGTIVEGTTDDIVRGYKDGYDIQQTGGGPEVISSDGTTFFLRIGSSRADGGAGGNGATGGDAGTGGGSGAGGSGYTDGSVTVVETQLGGSQYARATVILRLAP